MAADDFDLGAFQVGDYWRAVEDKVRSENITKILYPPDETPAGKQLRLEQQYFFVSCTLQDCIRLLLQRTTIRAFGEKFAIQLNDTHPALAIAELMRLLMDVHGLEWDEAWQITLRSFSYTNHTLMPESLEKWSSALFARLLPRHLEIVHEINRRFIEDVRAKFPGDEMRVRRMSLIEEGVVESRVRMAHLATLGSHTINGVAEIHSNLLKQTVLRDFAEMYPERFTNVTNGVTPRRFIGLTNPRLSQLLTEAIGDGWLTDAERLAGLERFADDSAFQEKWRAVKRSNKQELAEWLSRAHRMALDPTTLVDAHCKRIHEYKRQLLNVLHIVWLHQRAQAGTLGDEPPRTFIFAGKAAPGYWMAKLIIRLIHGVSTALDQDPAARGRLKVLFVPDFNVKSAQRIYPAVDVSEQISTSGTEASGTGNMKLAFNGALTIGTPDGANPEIRNAVGPENFFLCGLTAEEVAASKKSGYSPQQILSASPELAKVVEAIARGVYSPEEPALFLPIARSLLDQDTFFVLADFQSYVECQRQVASTWKDVPRWTRASILNVARCGRFSSDRSVREYAERIWKVTAVDMVP
jgi:starch phosphorylase